MIKRMVRRIEEIFKNFLIINARVGSTMVAGGAGFYGDNMPFQRYFLSETVFSGKLSCSLCHKPFAFC
ncbi:hypothetical protein BL250_14980 [Erwinia sp. OLTSP20]|nr:hypothetical protein BV501_17630 [Erwinia sp. OAMSP11]PIJ68866.1 hypothetical protein BK416_15895 [Erwinia sp. OLSSP12]PIJ80086.1 hypothetical protein BLD46_16080 [Erwinia sp. OLMTSP26]PIJ81543.1 hypothetical protein BLD49_16405 [Erwinia sp. OLMDSP33]PIJ82711.1 hypothetical protein BLD47_06315 [Erwinia sp. OLCASP19]PIJ89917.1 hypothetical protein BL250_14980 [Erwinia sp. OLTSP20]PIJ89966.1 hypothetical protein BL249_14575 [Erwinia sp. OLFS4]